jgi:hypothetical protein
MVSVSRVGIQEGIASRAEYRAMWVLVMLVVLLRVLRVTRGTKVAGVMLELVAGTIIGVSDCDHRSKGSKRGVWRGGNGMVMVMGITGR